MKQLMFIRHGNALRKPGDYDHEEDVLLSDKGKCQVERLKPFLRSFSPDLVVSSTVPRCKQTAEILSPEFYKKAEVKYDSRLRERSFTSLYNLSFEEIEKRYGKEKVEVLRKNSEKFHIKGEETIDEARHRVVSALTEHARNAKNRIVVISHGGPHSWFMCHLMNVGHDYIRKFPLGEARLSLFEFYDDGSPAWVLSMNAGDDPCHYIAEL